MAYFSIYTCNDYASPPPCIIHYSGKLKNFFKTVLMNCACLVVWWFVGGQTTVWAKFCFDYFAW